MLNTECLLLNLREGVLPEAAKYATDVENVILSSQKNRLLFYVIKIMVIGAV
jgi:hypothetical protein